ncbi:HAD hydrolase-like protein [Marinobacter sp. ELB17]|uniref:HAD hydrolase-like protein n=1 Tax=Marinobacter sp. ELB17 TaxID=270374 RepID=UPI0000F36D85|nr:phosphatase/phosphohexomutase-like protein [Marinobacter sp. ELB17]
MSIQAVLFDHDGTLVNSEPVHLELWNSVLSTYGFQLSDRQYKDLYAGLPTPANASDLVSRFGLSTDAIALASAVLPSMNAACDYIQRVYLDSAREA